jgi:hypothetical protein
MTNPIFHVTFSPTILKQNCGLLKNMQYFKSRKHSIMVGGHFSIIQLVGLQNSLKYWDALI